jgi:hypothetical protein
MKTMSRLESDIHTCITHANQNCLAIPTYHVFVLSFEGTDYLIPWVQWFRPGVLSRITFQMEPKMTSKSIKIDPKHP